MKICCFCPADVAPLVVGGFEGGYGKADLLLGAAHKRPLPTPMAVAGRCSV